jgi:hypothetical protein
VRQVFVVPSCYIYVHLTRDAEEAVELGEVVQISYGDKAADGECSRTTSQARDSTHLSLYTHLHCTQHTLTIPL